MLVIARVEVFDVLYMTKCMQSAATLVVGFGIIVVDMAHNYVVIKQLSRLLKTVKRYAEIRDISLGLPEVLSCADGPANARGHGHSSAIYASRLDDPEVYPT